LQRVLDKTISDFGSVSPDGNWVTVTGIGGVIGTTAVSLRDGTLKTICSNYCAPRWSADGAYLYVTMNPGLERATPTLVFPIPKGAGLPSLPAQGVAPSAAQGPPAPGITKITQDWPGPGPDPQTYAFVKSEFVGNLFRIPLH
jgi:hypothetical protein